MKRTKLEEILLEALSHLIDRLYEKGSLDLVSDEGVIEDAQYAIREAERNPK